jgi:choline dehydrogenase-like flavoprotein
VLIDATALLPGSTLTGTVCVIGSGAAGTTAALELARRGVDVMLLEAGAERRTREYQATYEGEVASSGLDTGSMHPPLDSVRVRKLGGTTGAWGGRCAPLDPIDFERRDHVDQSGWPVSRDTLEPYYRKAAASCATGEHEFSSTAALVTTEPFLLRDDSHDEIDDTKLFRYSPPIDWGKTYRPELQRRRNVRAYHHANVLRLERDQSGQRIVAAVVAARPGREFRVEADFFVIATGGLETARLLLESERYRGTGTPSLVGHYYMTHLDGVAGSLRFDCTAPRAAYRYEVTRDGVYCRRLVCLTPEAKRAGGLLNFGAVLYVPSPEDPAHGDGLLSSFALAKDAMQRTKAGFKSRRHAMDHSEPLDYSKHLANVARNPWALPRFSVEWTRKRWLASRKLPSFLMQPASGEYRLLFSAEQSPAYANRVELSDQWDAFGLPRLKVLWSVKEQDYESILRSLQIVARNIRALGSGTVDTPASVDDLRAEIGGGFFGGTHAMGTARMSASPKDGVVDAMCRLHGVGNLYVASSAVFPTGGYAPPMLTIVALSIRVADTIYTRTNRVSSRAQANGVASEPVRTRGGADG